MDYKLEDLIDIPLIQNLLDKLNLIYSFPSAIIDNEGNILTAVAWQDVCTKFHRLNPQSEKECIKSDQYILSHIHEANPSVSYQCPHGLVDNATPIIIDGKHLGNFFTGQFFLEKPDLEYFKKQAKICGFDEKAYLEAVEKVPIWTKEKLSQYLDFIKEFIEIIAGIGLKNLKQTEIKKAEEEIALLAHAVKSISECISITDVQNNILFVNQSFLDIYGYSNEELIGQHISIVSSPNNPPGIIQDILSATLHGGWEGELLNRKKDGSEFLISLSTSKVYNQYGNTISLIGVTTDITERKNAEKELRETKQIIEGIIHTIPARVFWKDKNLVYLGCNAAFARDAGYSDPKDIIGKDDFKLSWHDQAELYRSDDRQVIESGCSKLNIEEPQTTPEGKTITLLTSKVTLLDFNGNISGVIGTYIDITERKKIEETLLESEEKFRSITEQTADLIALTDTSGCITYASAASRAIFQYEPEEMCGHFFMEFLNESSVPRAMAAFQDAIELGTVSKNLELEMKRKDGSLFFGELNGSLFRSNRLNGSLVIIHDITDRKQSEEKIHRQLEELQRWQEVTLGREDRNRQLKHEVNELLIRLGETIRYPSQEGNPP